MKMKEITEIAKLIDVEVEPYGRYIGKVPLKYKDEGERRGGLILVTAINPTPAGEGKTTTSIGLADALRRMGKNAMLTLREPSLGPFFGVKGGATGGGKAVVLPSQKINLHFTGDFHAVTSAHNLIAAMLDNALHFGTLDMPADEILWKRVLDMNDRSLRQIVVGIGSHFVRNSGFEITPASEIMAILGLSLSPEEMRERIGNILLGFDRDKKPVYVKNIKAEGGAALLLEDAIKPNLVQTGEGTPVLIHTGPFANIAHGTNSIIAMEIALRRADWVVVEAGFGSDLGAEKFIDIVQRKGDLPLKAVVIVASIRALKYHGGVKKKHLTEENVEAVKKGFVNLLAHVDNIRAFGYEPVVAVNRFEGDTDAELGALTALLDENGIQWALSEVFARGGEGGIALAEKVLENARDIVPNYVYDLNDPIETKIEKLAKRVYRAEGVTFTAEAKKILKRVKKIGLDNLPICMAKTQYSLTHDPSILGVPTEPYIFKVSSIKISAGAGFIVPISGDIMTMPGLPKVPEAVKF